MRKVYTLCCLAWALTAAMFSQPATAQNRSYGCYTDEHFAEQAARNPQLLEARADLDEKIRQILNNQAGGEAQRGVTAEKRIVPVVFHVIHTATGAGDASRANILAALLTLNRDFNRLNSDTAAGGSVRFPGASMDIEFRLATKDPDGNCTDGITRHESPLSAGVDPRDQIKGVYSWPTDKYFNIWVVDYIAGEIQGGGQIAGYAQFPMGQQGLGWDTWGIVVISSSLNGTDRTLSHEMGHCFNLYHTFQGGCPNANCNTQGDQVCDTPPGIQTQSCNRSQNTCSTDSPNRQDMIENYMSYDNCQNMFTPGQRARVYAAINAVSQLQTLSSPANLVATGTADGTPAPGLCAPQAHFYAGRTQACGATPVEFFSNVYNTGGDNTTRYLWTIGGSDSGTYHTARPRVVFTTPGIHDVTLVASNASGSDTLVRSQFISSRPAQGVGAVPMLESFEATNFPSVEPEFYKNWEITSNNAASNWEISPAGLTGRSLRVLHNITTGSYSRNLISPGLNLSGSGRLVMYFWRAHKRRFNTPTTDRLNVSFSTDCGSTWQNLKTWSDDASDPNQLLYTTPQVQTGLYTAPQPSEWKLDSVILSTRISSAFRSNVRIRFESVNSNANTLFIDDIFFGSNMPVGVRNQLAGNTGLTLEVMPNPGAGSAEIKWTANGSLGKATVELLDAAGRVIASRRVAAGGTEGSLTVSELAPGLQKGVYLLRFRSEKAQQATRFVLE